MALGSGPLFAFGSYFGGLGCGQRNDRRKHDIGSLLIGRGHTGDRGCTGAASAVFH